MMSDAESDIPVIDCSSIGLHVKNEDIKETDIHNVGKQMQKAFSTVGFCYLKNHGMDENTIKRFFEESVNFFTLLDEVKERQKMQGGRNFGWIGSEKEKLTDYRPPDLKEGFNYCPKDEQGPEDWPNEGFERSIKKIFDTSTAFALRLLDCLSVGIDLDKSFLANAHTAIGRMGNTTTLRANFYPPLPDTSVIKPDQVRLAEHSDFGTISLVFQDDVGGLEAKVPGKGYIPVKPIPGAIVVNLGDLMQRWSADSLLATKHRFRIPEDEMLRNETRQSIAFFVQPDDDYEIKPLDGSNKYEPTTSKNYLREKFLAMWGK